MTPFIRILSISWLGGLALGIGVASAADPESASAGSPEDGGWSWSWSWDWATGPALGDEPGERDWGVDVTPYLWLSGLDGEAAYPATSTVPINATFDSLASSLDGGLAGFIDVRFRRWHLLSNNFWVRLKDTTNLPLGGSARTTLSNAFGTAALAYELPLPTSFAVDLYLGGRWWNQKADLSITTAGGASFQGDRTEKWADAVGGVRLRYRITDSWRVGASGDIGGGDSKLTWSVEATVGYDINRYVGFTAGYRILGVNYRDSGFVYDARQQGLLLGLRVGY